MGLGGGGVGGCCFFCDDVPVVVVVGDGLGTAGGDVLALDAPRGGVVIVFNDFIVGEGDLGEAVFAIPSVGFSGAVA